jgi:signal transduction histidine kinase
LPPIPPETATALYRICQEAMTNVARHSGAARVVLRLDAEQEAIALRVEDDGRGLDATAVESPLALGLLGMAERATMVGGEVRFERGDSGGTIVTARIPIGGAPGRPRGSP